MKRIALFVLLALSTFANMLPTTIMHPARLMFYSIYPHNLQTADSFTLTLAETNDYDKEQNYYIDFELTSLTFIANNKLTSNDSLRIVVPLYKIWGGFMDRALDAFHDATGTLNGTKHNEDGTNKVHFFFAKASKSHPFATLGNIQLEYKHTFTLFNTPQALLGGIKFPTASKSSGFGSGKTDLMLGWIAQKGSFTLELNLAYIGRYTFKKTSAKRLHYFASLSWHKGPWYLDYRFASSPFTSKHKELESTSNVIDLGYRYKNLLFFVSENLSPFHNSPDFTLGIVYRF